MEDLIATPRSGQDLHYCSLGLRELTVEHLLLEPDLKYPFKRLAGVLMNVGIDRDNLRVVSNALHLILSDVATLHILSESSQSLCPPETCVSDQQLASLLDHQGGTSRFLQNPQQFLEGLKGRQLADGVLEPAVQHSLHGHLDPLFFSPTFEGGEDIHVVLVADLLEMTLGNDSLVDKVEQLDEDSSAQLLLQLSLEHETEGHAQLLGSPVRRQTEQSLDLCAADYRLRVERGRRDKKRQDVKTSSQPAPLLIRW